MIITEVWPMKFSYLLFILCSLAVSFSVFSDTGMETKKIPFIAYTTTELILRQSPSDKAPKVKCDLYGKSEAGLRKKGATSLPEGFSVNVIERSEKKAKVGKWNSYWYKIEATNPNDGGPASCEVNGKAVTAWVFGEFLKPEEE